MRLLPDTLIKVFRAAGWSDGRHVEVPATVPIDHPAYSVLAELGGLMLVRPAPHINSIKFQHVTNGASDMIAWETALNTIMVGIAEQDDGHATIYLSSRGQVIGCSNVHPACYLIGRTMDEALDAIGSSKRAQPMLLPDDDEITLYGVTFHQGDDQVVELTELL